MEDKQKPSLHNIQNIIQHPDNKKTVDQIVQKMGRLLAKKQNLIDQPPQLVYQDRIWLGNYMFANDMSFLKSNNITHVFSCLQLNPSIVIDGITYKKYPLKDGNDSRFEKIVTEFCQEVKKTKGNNIFVHCFSGISRSVALVIAYVMMGEKLSYQEAAQKIRTQYPLGKINKFFENELKRINFNINESPLLNIIEDNLNEKKEEVQIIKQIQDKEKQNIQDKIEMCNNRQQQVKIIQNAQKTQQKDLLNLISYQATPIVNICSQIYQSDDNQHLRQANLEVLNSHAQKTNQEDLLCAQQNQIQKLQTIKNEEDKKDINKELLSSLQNTETSLLQTEGSKGGQIVTPKIEYSEQKQKNKTYLLDFEEKQEKSEPTQLEPLNKQEQIVEQSNFQQKKKKNKKKKK